MNTAADRMPRLLALVPYLLARPGISLAQAASDFDVPEAQLRRDLNLLWMCGLPGQGPGDLIDLAFEGDTVSVLFDAGMSRPLKLTAQEALTLAVALRTLAETPGATDRDAVERALAKVESAAGGVIEAADAVQVSIDAETAARPVVQRALDTAVAVELRYFTATRDEVTERVVDPLRLFTAQGRTYLEAWCRRAEGMRVFRLDRIERATVLTQPAQIPAHVQPRDLSEGVYAPAPEHLLVDLVVSPEFEWVVEHYTAEPAGDPPGRTGSTEPGKPGTAPHAGPGRHVAVRASDPAWIRSLVLGSGGGVRVLAPVWLAEEIRAGARRALANYPAPASRAARPARPS